MKSVTKKSILTVLEGSQKALSASDILLHFESGLSDRSLRRWLNALVEEGYIEKLGKGRATKYQINLELDARNLQKENLEQEPTVDVFSLSALQVINLIKRPLFERSPVIYDFDWFDSYLPNQSSYLSIEQLEALQKAGFRQHQQEPAGTYARRIYDRLLIDLSFNSSRLEGNTYSLLETEKLLSAGVKVDGKLDSEKVMIINHKEAIRYLIDHAGFMRIEPDEVCTLHFLLSDALVDNEYAGKVRDHGVRIGGSTYTPVENKEILLMQLSHITQKADKIHNPFEQSLFLLIHIAYLQAFIDVNKRTSRLCANIPLVRHNCVPLSFNGISTEDYTNAMVALYELKDPKPIAELYCYSYLRTCMQYDATIESLGFDLIRVKYRQVRRELIRKIVVEDVHGTAIDPLIAKCCEENIEKEDYQAFTATVNDDLGLLSPARIGGMGITRIELNQWMSNRKDN